MADSADLASDIMERRQEAALANRPALHTVADAEECDDCGDEIPTARRKAAPWATTCIECQGMRERRGRHVR